MAKDSTESIGMLLGQIAEINSHYHDVDLIELTQSNGLAIANLITQKYGSKKSICFLCGKDNNISNAFATAQNLIHQNYTGEISVYLLARPSGITFDVAKHFWQELRTLKAPNLSLYPDGKPADISNHQIIVECLQGSVTDKKPPKKYRDALKRATHFRQQMINIDLPLPGYSWDLSISTLYPKTADAITIDQSVPSQIYTDVGPGQVKALNIRRGGKLLLINLESNLAQESNISRFLEFHHAKALHKHLLEIELNDLESADVIILDIPRSNVGILGAITNVFKSRGDTPVVITNSTAKALLESDVEDLANTVLVIDSHNKYTGEMFGLPNPEGNILRWAVGNNAHVVYADSRQDRVFGEGLDGNPSQRFVRSKPIVEFKSYETTLIWVLSCFLLSNHPSLAAEAASFLQGVATHFKGDFIQAWDKVVSYSE